MLSHYTGLPLPLHRPPPSPQPSQKDNNPSPCTTTLASLVKGEVLSPEKIRATTGGIVLRSHNPSKTTSTPRPAPPPLPPLSKVRCCRPKEFGRLPEGLSHQPFTPHQPFKNRTIPRSAPHSRLPCQRQGAVARKNSGDYRRNCHTNLSLRTNLSKTALSHPLFVGRGACPSRCIDPLNPHNPRKRTIIPRPAPPPLPPLSKGGGLTARHKLLSCCVLIATHLPFLFTKLFCRQDGGIASVASTPSIPTTLAKGQ